MKEIRVRVAEPVQFEWLAQIAEPGDVISDPSVAWPESRRLIKLGTLTITHVAPEQGTLDKATIFLPSNVPTGIETADPMLDVRSAAYPVSFSHRQ